MTVKELIDLLWKCDINLLVSNGCEEYTYVVEHTDHTNPENSYVEIV